MTLRGTVGISSAVNENAIARLIGINVKSKTSGFGSPLAEGWSLPSAIFDNIIFDIVGIDDKINGIHFSPDEFLKAYFIADQFSGTGRVYEIDLATANTLTGAVYNGNNHFISNKAPTGMFIDVEGLRLYTVEYATTLIVQRNIVEAWDITNVGGVVGTVNLTGVANNPIGVWFAGNKMFVADQVTNEITQWNIPTPGSLTGVTYDSVSLDVSNETGSLTDLFIRPDGTKLIIATAGTSKGVYQYDLPAKNRLNGSSFDEGVFFNFPTGINDVFFDRLGYKMWTANNVDDEIQQYTLTS